MNAIVTPGYWEQATRELSEADELLAKLIVANRPLHMRSRGDAFTTLARSIVGQQVSVKAAEAIWARVLDKLGNMSPQALLCHAQSDLQTCGLSSRKAMYLHELSHYFIATPYVAGEWELLADDEVMKRLMSIKGIGQWTAEMFLIFFMARPNILPVGDIGLQRAMSLHYNDGQPISKLKMREVARRWQPWHSVATWYMWRSLEPLPIQY
ncbi:DNA-3-methyladenine glycosylase II [Chitinivorax tropicus]|uniref:DNA-3-methyladenine glycosylase II n=1 Tax=Chitinivorax tropicus TaxID=714531 RepID=A0A840MRJ3_9PROT|nr:DNA-3-methyladenine glycosylase 2 family protein [Chitinivorax tropicus]MBB5019699.1 DNA-3-methyladenine glycosylase II [Chitinivorax tropicus]